MDLVSPLYPSVFVFVVCLGSLSRSFSKFSPGTIFSFSIGSGISIFH